MPSCAPDIDDAMSSRRRSRYCRSSARSLRSSFQFDTCMPMNTPSTTDGNWSWRMRLSDLAPDTVARLRMLTETYDRTPID